MIITQFNKFKKNKTLIIRHSISPFGRLNPWYLSFSEFREMVPYDTHCNIILVDPYIWTSYICVNKLVVVVFIWVWVSCVSVWEGRAGYLAVSLADVKTKPLATFVPTVLLHLLFRTIYNLKPQRQSPLPYSFHTLHKHEDMV